MLRTVIFWILTAVPVAGLGWLAGSALELESAQASVTDYLLESENLARGFHDGLGALKEQIQAAYASDEVQKFSRPGMRKAWATDRKEDSQNAVLRIMSASVDFRDEEIRVREVFDSHKPAAIWEKVLDMLAKEALKRSGEYREEGDAKLQGMVGMLMKGSGLGELTEPGQFHELSFLGAPSLFYWNTIHKRCPAAVTRETGAEECVRGLFLAEIDLLNYSRDYFASRSAIQDDLGRAAVFSDPKGNILQLFSVKEEHNADLALALKKALQLKTAVLEEGKQFSVLARPASGLKHTAVALWAKNRQALYGLDPEKLPLAGALLGTLLALALAVFARILYQSQPVSRG